MTLTPSTVRCDLKCGKGAISKGEKCTKGAAQEVIEKAAPIALGLGLAAGAIALHRRGKRPRIGDGRTVPNIPKTPPKPGKVSSPASKAQAEAMATRVTERVKQRVRENPQKIAYEMQAEEIKSAAMRDVVRSKKFQDAFKSRAMTMEELAELARDPDAFDKWMKRTDSALTPSAIRSDLKCGKGAISKGEKCTKGTATPAKPDNTIRNIALGVGGAAALGGIALGATKMRATQRIASKPLGKNATPDQGIAQGKAAFKQARGVPLGAEIAGAGLGIAGAGLMANEYAKEPRKRQAGAIMAGGALMYLGTGTYMSGRSMRTNLAAKEAEWTTGAEDYKRQWNSAREQAQQRAKQNAASGSQGSRNVGANKAVENPFKDLDIPESASDADVKKQWLKLMRAHHPDVGGDPKKAQQINAAYQEILRRRGKLDSIYADGFNIDWEAIAL